MDVRGYIYWRAAVGGRGGGVKTNVHVFGKCESRGCPPFHGALHEKKGMVDKRKIHFDVSFMAYGFSEACMYRKLGIGPFDHCSSSAVTFLSNRDNPRHTSLDY
jgi:hypothetical protein